MGILHCSLKSAHTVIESSTICSVFTINTQLANVCGVYAYAQTKRCSMLFFLYASFIDCMEVRENVNFIRIANMERESICIFPLESGKHRRSLLENEHPRAWGNISFQHVSAWWIRGASPVVQPIFLTTICSLCIQNSVAVYAIQVTKLLLTAIFHFH